MESEIKKIGESLSTLKSQELSDEKLNSLIDLSLKQNEILEIVHKMAKMTMERSVNTFENIQVALEAHNNGFENSRKWMDAQDKYNDDVADRLSDLINSIGSLKR